MSAIASWARRHRPELLWGSFSLVNFAILVTLVNYETVPFHFVWVSLTLLYGYRVWGPGPTFAVLAGVCVASTVTMGYVVAQGAQGIDELTEVPLMSAMFLAMVWHARRRQSALDEMRRSAERERDFVRDASHQLKTPIAIARGLADLIKENDGPYPQRRDDVMDLVDELDRLGELAEDLLLLATAEQPGTLVTGAVDVEDLVVSAARRWSRSAARVWRVDAQVDGVVSGDRQRLDAALDAVVENAVEATVPEDSIVLSVRALDDDAVVEVRDTGRGIPMAALPRVFDRFASIARDGVERRGTGLGLPIARAIAEAHGGAVSIRSILGQGTVVTFRLPGLTVQDADGAQAAPLPLPDAA
jgi:two-component system OmpR family sensor kinase